MSQQLVKKGANGRIEHVNPRSWIEAIKDKNTGQTLVGILQGFNMYFLPYNGNTSSTRCLVPTMLRKKGLWITYVKYDGNVYTEWYAANEIDDKSWGDSSNWRIGNNTLVGDITISANGNWVINGIETEFKAVGEKGNTPLLRVANNRLQVSYDLGDTYIDVTNSPVYTKFRWLATTGDTQANNVGRIQASVDEGKTWTNMSNDFTNNLHIKKYIGVNESLPTSGIAEGTIYAKGPYYAEDDTLNDNPIYRLWVYAWKDNTLAWQDNGEFQSIAAGVVQETGDSETEVMSQKAVTEKLSELGSKVGYTEAQEYSAQNEELLTISPVGSLFGLNKPLSGLLKEVSVKIPTGKSIDLYRCKLGKVSTDYSYEKITTLVSNGNVTKQEINVILNNEFIALGGGDGVVIYDNVGSGGNSFFIRPSLGNWIKQPVFSCPIGYDIKEALDSCLENYNFIKGVERQVEENKEYSSSSYSNTYTNNEEINKYIRYIQVECDEDLSSAKFALRHLGYYSGYYFFSVYDLNTNTHIVNFNQTSLPDSGEHITEGEFNGSSIRFRFSADFASIGERNLGYENPNSDEKDNYVINKLSYSSISKNIAELYGQDMTDFVKSISNDLYGEYSEDFPSIADEKELTISPIGSLFGFYKAIKGRVTCISVKLPSEKRINIYKATLGNSNEFEYKLLGSVYNGLYSANVIEFKCDEHFNNEFIALGGGDGIVIYDNVGSEGNSFFIRPQLGNWIKQPVFSCPIGYVIKEIVNIEKPKETVSINIDDTIYSYVGDCMQIFKYPLINVTDYNRYNINMYLKFADKNDAVKKLAIGINYERYFEFNPIEVGEYILIIQITDETLNVVAEKSVTIVVNDVNSITSDKKNVLFIGDSETYGATAPTESESPSHSFASEVYDLLISNRVGDESNPSGMGKQNIQLVGRITAGNGRNEGYGGVNAWWFLNNQSSPFFVNGSYNINNYLSQEKVYTDTSYKGVDYIYILLGANDNPYVTYNGVEVLFDVNSHKSHLKNLLSKIKSDVISGGSTNSNQNLKVVLMTYVSPYNSSGSRYYQTYDKNGNMMSKWFEKIYKANKEIAELEEFSSFVECYNPSSFVDSENAYITANKPKNSRSTELEIVKKEQLHPNKMAYLQFGQAVVRHLINKLI